MNAKSGLLNLFTASLTLLVFGAAGCAEREPKYGVERQLSFPVRAGEVWAVAPAINLSGYREVDPLLQADLLFQQLQQVRGLTVIPVNRVAEVYAKMKIEKIESPKQAAAVCDALRCDRLIVPTITAYDPYVPPKIGASLQLLGIADANAEGARQAAGRVEAGLDESDFIQAVGMFDAANGTVRDALLAYAAGRHDPTGPMGPGEYFASIDRYCGFVYHELIEQVIDKLDRARTRG